MINRPNRKAKVRIEKDNSRMNVYPEKVITTTANFHVKRCPIQLKDVAVGTMIVNLICS